MKSSPPAKQMMLSRITALKDTRLQTAVCVLEGWIDSCLLNEDPELQLLHEFGSDACGMETAPVPTALRSVLWTIVALVLLALIWSFVGHVNEVEIAPGRVATRIAPIVIQPIATGRVEAIAVHEGDYVHKGQILVRLDPAFAQADLKSMQAKWNDLISEITRLEREIAESNSNNAPTLTSEGSTQDEIFAQDMTAYQAQREAFSARAASLQEQITADENSIVGLKQQLAMANKVVGIRNYLLTQNAGAPLDVMSAKSGAIDVNNRLQSLLSDLAKLKQQNTENDMALRIFTAKWREDINEKVLSAKRKLVDVSTALTKAKKSDALTLMRAPADATVLQLAGGSAGSMVHEGETLATLIADHSPLYVAVNFVPSAIGRLHVGQRVDVMLDAYPFQRYGTVRGRVASIGADSVSSADSGLKRFNASIELDEGGVALARRGIILRPGLEVTAQVKVGRRSVASYILDPIIGTLHNSLTEP